MTHQFFIAAAAATLALSAGAASAQTAAPATTPPPNHGPAITGLCILSPQVVVSQSTVGKYVGTRLQQILAQVNAELNAEKTAIDAEAKTLEGQRTTLDQKTLETRVTALQTKMEALNRKAQQRDAEVQATEQKALARISTEMNPLVRDAYQAKNCSILLEREAVLLANPASDITAQVVTALNGKLTQFAFDRERLDNQAAPAAR